MAKKKEQPKQRPCAECPFRKKSAPGWIGGHQNVGEIIDIVEAGHKFPCHTRVNRFMEIQRECGCEPDFEEACEQSPTCMGALSFLANCLKLPRNPYVALQVRIVGKNPDVFSSRKAMTYHHAAAVK
jgi:hypothetical protein